MKSRVLLKYLRLSLVGVLSFGFIACKRAEVVAPGPATTPVPPPPNIRFVGYTGNPMTPLKDISFQVDGPDSHASDFLKMGEIVPKTRFKLTAFQHQIRHNPQTGADEDASELTLVNIETRQVVVLTPPKPRDSPPVF